MFLCWLFLDPKRYEQIKQEIMKLGLEFSMASMFTAFSIPDDSKLFSLRSSFETMPKSQSVKNKLKRKK